jgi:two-component sensor histidine kinase
MEWPKWTRRLLVRIFLLLSLALLPIGLIAVYQTARVAAASQQNANLALLALTDKAASEEQELIQRAFGSALMLGIIVDRPLQDPETCNYQLARVVRSDPLFKVAKITSVSGEVLCTSDGNFRTTLPVEVIESWSQEPSPHVRIDTRATAAEPNLLTVWQPFFRRDELRGFVSISFPQTEIKNDEEFLRSKGLVNLVTFNQNGTILTSHTGLESANSLLPEGVDLDNIEPSASRLFRAKDISGVQRLYTVSPVRNSPITIMGIWKTRTPLVAAFSDGLPPATFPVLMWVASLGVAMLALHTLVLRHVNQLRTDIRSFEQTRKVSERVSGQNIPLELDEVYSNFHDMSETIVREEARLEDLVRDKNVLIKEVHHRVKNNLQMIVSIMSMQIGNAKHAETRHVLERLQDRVLSLATIHRDLYQSQNKGQVQVTPLVAEIIQKTLEIAQAKTNGIKLFTSYDPLMLYPDQAVPLSLLVSETITNALKYLGAEPGQNPTIEVSLKNDDGDVTFTVTNSTGGAAIKGEGTGMGSKLMQGFALQLGGKLEKEISNSQYILQIRFKRQNVALEVTDF